MPPRERNAYTSNEQKTGFSELRTSEDHYKATAQRGRTDEYEKQWLGGVTGSPKGSAINKFSPTLKASPYSRGAEHDHGRGLSAKDRIRVVTELDPTKPHYKVRTSSPVRVRGLRGTSPSRQLHGVSPNVDQPFKERNRDGPSRRFKASDKEGVNKMLHTKKKSDILLM